MKYGDLAEILGEYIRSKALTADSEFKHFHRWLLVMSERFDKGSE